MLSRFIPNPAFERELIREGEYVEGLKEVAQAGVDNAKEIARAEAYDEGDYHDSIRVTAAGADVYVSAFDFKSNWIEFGSVRNPPSAPLRRGIRAAGLTFRESSE